MNKLIIALLLLASGTCLADEAFVGYGIGILNDANERVGQNIYFEGGAREILWGNIYGQYRVGYWKERSTDDSRRSGVWASAGLGLLVNLQPVELRSGWSIAGISNPDSQLGGHFPEFNGEFYLGLRDKKGAAIGLQYEHISSAGIVMPNQGRDFVTLQLGQSW